MQRDVYRLNSLDHAKKKAKKLVSIVDLMGIDLKLTKGQEVVAGLMGYENWTELAQTTKNSPDAGTPDQMLDPAMAKRRLDRQIELIEHEFKLDPWTAHDLLAILAPTGNPLTATQKRIDDLGLRIDQDDVMWLQQSMDLVKDFDGAARNLYSIVGTMLKQYPNPQCYFTHVSVHRNSGDRVHHTDTTPDDIIESVAMWFPDKAPLAGKALTDVESCADIVCRSFSNLNDRIRSLGDAPILAPIDWTFMMLWRNHTSQGEASYFTPICAEPVLHLGFDMPDFCFNAEIEHRASEVMALYLAMRREFLDAGWNGTGQEWDITFRDGNSAKENIRIYAESAGAACAWAAAARAALRLPKGQTLNNFSIISVRSADGVADRESALAAAKNHPIIRRGKLVDAYKLRVRGREPAARS